MSEGIGVRLDEVSFAYAEQAMAFDVAVEARSITAIMGGDDYFGLIKTVAVTGVPLTEQRRKEYVKIVKNMAEDGRVAVRNIRRDARKHLEAAEKAAEISADQLERAEKELEKITHDHVELIDKALGRKEQELLEV